MRPCHEDEISSSNRLLPHWPPARHRYTPSVPSLFDNLQIDSTTSGLESRRQSYSSHIQPYGLGFPTEKIIRRTSKLTLPTILPNQTLHNAHSPASITTTEQRIVI